MELIRSDLSVQQEDQLRSAFSEPIDGELGQPRGDAPQSWSTAAGLGIDSTRRS